MKALRAWRQRHHITTPLIALVSGLVGLSVIAGCVYFLGQDGKQPPASQAHNIKELSVASNASDQDTLSYSTFNRLMQKRQIQAAIMNPRKPSVSFFYKTSEQPAEVLLPPDTSARISDRLAQSGADVAIDKPPVVLSFKDKILKWPGILLPIIGLTVLGIFIWFVNKGYREGDGDGAAKAPAEIGALREDVQLDELSTPTNTFQDVAGCDEVIEEMQEFVDFLVSPEHYHRVGAKVPSGVILHGPPGTGKTLIAKALAGEAKVPFFAVSGSEFVDKYVGVGASRVRELFEQARTFPDGAVIFIDEIDAVGQSRSGSDAIGNREHDQTLNELLAQLDGFNDHDHIIVVGATNRLELLDPALLRPGRLSRHIPVDIPAEKGRLDILKLYAKGKPFDDTVDLNQIAKITSGMSGADLADMLNEAAIMAARQQRVKIGQDDIVEGQLRALAGPIKKDNHMGLEEQATVAYHEAGHVLCAELCHEHQKAQRSSIRPRGRTGGLAMYGQEDRGLHSPQFVFEQLVCLLGGRAAEWVKYGAVSSGAANDLQRATKLARTAVQELGFSPQAGQLSIHHSGAVSDRTREVMDREVEKMIAQAYGESVRLLKSHHSEMESLAQAMIKELDLDRAQIIEAIAGASGDVLAPAVRTVLAHGPELVPVLHQAIKPADS